MAQHHIDETDRQHSLFPCGFENNSSEQTCGGVRTKLLNRMENSTLHFNYHAKEGFTDTLKRKASQDMKNPTVINLDEDNKMHCLGCSFLSGTGAVLKRSCRSENNAMHDLSQNGQKFCSGDEREADDKASDSRRGSIKDGSSHAPSKLQNKEHNDSFKSFLAMEIKRQVLDGLGETGHSQVQDLQVIEIDDIVSSVGASSNANSEEESENNHPTPYFVKMKLLATVCMPIFLQTGPQSSFEKLPLTQTNAWEVDGLLCSKEFPTTKSSQMPLEYHQAASMKPHSVFTKQCNPQVLQEESSPRVSQVKYEKSFCKVPSASIMNMDHPATYSCDLPEWRDRFDSVVRPTVMNDFELHDFDADKTEDKFNEGQIWALYDDSDGMPRHYAQITEVLSVRPFEVSITWLEPKTRSMEALMWLTSGVSITCGAFELRNQQDPITLTHVHHFSHPMKSQPGLEGEILISPSKGEVWALYKDQIAFSFTSQRIGGKYELVQVVDKDGDSQTLTVVPLLKIGGFRTRFVQEEWPFTIAPKDFLKFSHRIPAYKLKEKRRAYLELDPVSTPKLFD